MAGINLTPNVGLIIGQGVLFSLGYLVVRNLMVVPYLRLKARRREITAGQSDDVSEIKNQIQERRQQMDENTRKTLSEVRELREASKAKAVLDARTIASKAQEKSDKDVQECVHKLQGQFQQQKQDVEKMADELSHQCLKKLL